MKIKRKAAAGLCILLLAQTCIPAGAAQGQSQAMRASTEAEEETKAESSSRAKESDEESSPARKETEEKKTLSLEQEVSLDQKSGEMEYEITVVAAEEPEMVLSFEVPKGYEVREAFLKADGNAEKKLTFGEDWSMKDGAFTCLLEREEGDFGEWVCRLVCSLTEETRLSYAKSGEALEMEVLGRAVLVDQDGKTLKEAPLSRETLKMEPFIRMEAESRQRAQKTYQWTDWLNLGFESGSGYLVAVIEDLEEGHHFDFENGEVTLAEEEGEVLEQIPVSELKPEEPKAFGEIFTAEDAQKLLGSISGAGFYTLASPEEEEKQSGILIVPVHDRNQPVGITYQTRVSASEQEAVYQWEADLKSGCKFVWSPKSQEVDAKEEKTDGETERLPEHPDWERKAERISDAQGEPAEMDSDGFASEAVWLEISSSCSLVSQKPGEDGYEKETGTAFWELFVNQNGEDVREAVITRELPADEQCFAGAPAEGDAIKAILYEEEEDWEAKSGKKISIPAWEEDMEEELEEEDGFCGYYVLEQDGGKTNRLELHLFRLGQGACEIPLETEIMDTVFAGSEGETSISSGKTEYTAVLGEEARTAEGSCDAEIAEEHSWMLLEQSADYREHTVSWEVMINPEERSLLEPQLTITLPEGLEQVTIDRVVMENADGKEKDVTEEEWIQVKETAASKKKDRTAVLNWKEPETEKDGEDEADKSEEPVSCRFVITCQVSEAFRDHTFFTEEPADMAVTFALDGYVEAEGTRKKLTNVEKAVSLEWNTAAVSAVGVYREDRYQQEDSDWDGFSMPRVDWSILINRNEADLTDDILTAAWPEEMTMDPASLRIYTTELESDGTEGKDREQIWPEKDAKEAGKEMAAESLQISDQELSFTIPEEYSRKVLAAEFSTFVTADMDKEAFAGRYQLKAGKDVLEQGTISAEGAKNASPADAARKNEIPSVVITAVSANSNRTETYPLQGARYCLTRMEAEEEETSWDSYEDGESEERCTDETGMALFLFVEPDVLYRIDETKPAPGYESWTEPKYLVVLDQKKEQDFPKEDRDHELIIGKTQICLEDEETPASWENGKETIKGGLLEFAVRDQDGQPLEQVKCSLTYVDYRNQGGRGLKSKTAVSDENGQVVFEGLDPLTAGEEGYEIHVTAPCGLEDPAEFSAVVSAEEDGTFSYEFSGKTAEKTQDGTAVTCYPVSVDIRIPVTDQNGNLLRDCGLTLKVETETEEETRTENKKTDAFQAYQACPQVKEAGDGFLYLEDFPYGTYRLSGGTSILTLVIEEAGVEAVLEAVEQENEMEDRPTVKLTLTADSSGFYGASEEDGWYLEQYLPRADLKLTLTDADQPEKALNGSRFLVYETWSNRLVGELTDEEEEGTYRLVPARAEDGAFEENDRGCVYVRDYGGACRLLPGTYAVWETEFAEGYQAEGDGVWYFEIGDGTEQIGNENLLAGDGSKKDFVNAVIRADVQVQAVIAEEEVTLQLQGIAWSAGSGEMEYEQEQEWVIGETVRFEQVPVGTYFLRTVTDKKSRFVSSRSILVQVRYDGTVVFRTISGRELEPAEVGYCLLYGQSPR